MSNKVDERITRIRFDNDQFERGVATSMQSLDRLKNKLESTESVEAFTGIQKAADKTDLSGITKAIEGIGDKFSVLRMTAINVLSDIATQVKNTGIAMVKNLSTDNIAAGWAKYDQEVQAVQTIMVTLDDTPIEEVEDHLQKIGWYSDETSYSYEEMVGSMSKLISAGVGLDDATNAVIGLANASAAAGVSTKKAQQAFYNFSQAFGAGYMQLQDWRSIELLNMATPEFKKNIIETAVSLGKLVKVGDDLYATSDNLNNPDSWFSTNAMRGSLKDKWFDNDVMTAVLNLYGEFANQVYETQHSMEGMEKGLDTASKTIDYLNDMGTAIDNVSNKAFIAAQEAKTFTEAIDSVKDAVSTKWKDTFKEIFGNYDEAKKTWSKFANRLYDLFALGGDERNSLLALWNDPGYLFEQLLPDERIRNSYAFPEIKKGREVLLDGLWNIYDSVENVVNVIKAAWRDVFPETTAFRLYEITRKFKDITSKIKGWTEDLSGVRSFLSGIFGIFKRVLDFGKRVFSFSKQLLPILSKVLEILKVVGSQGWTFFKDMLSYLKVGDKVEGGLTKLEKAFDKVKNAIINFDASTIRLPTFEEFLNAIQNLKINIGDIKDHITTAIQWVGRLFKKYIPEDTIQELVVYTDSISESTRSFTELINPELKNTKSNFKTTLDVITKFFGKVQNIFSKVTEFLKTRFKDFDLKDALGTGVIGVLSWFTIKVGKATDSVSQILVNLGDSVSKGVSYILTSVGDIFVGFTNIANAYAKNIKADTITTYIKSIAYSILAIVAALYLFSKIDDADGKLEHSLKVIGIIGVTLAGLCIVLATVESILNRTTKSQSFTGFSIKGVQLGGTSKKRGILGVIAGVLGMALAIRMVAKTFSDPNMSVDKMRAISAQVNNLAYTIVACVIALEACSAAISKASPGKSKMSFLAPVSMATSMLLMIKVFEKIDKMEIVNLKKVVVGLLGILVTMGLFSLALGRIDAGVGIGMLGIAASILLFMHALEKIQDANITLEGKGGFIAIFFGLLAVLGLISIFSKKSIVIDKNKQKLKSLGTNMLSIIIGLIACVGAIYLLSRMTNEEVIRGGLATLVLLAALFTGVSVMLKIAGKAGEYAGRGSLRLVAVLLAITLISGIFTVLARFDSKSLGIAVGFVMLLSLAVDGMMLSLSAIKDKPKGVMAAVGLLAALAAVVTAFYLFAKDDPSKLHQAILSIIGLAAGISLACFIISRISSASIIAEGHHMLELVFGLLIALGTTTILLSRWVEDADKALTGAEAISLMAVTISIACLALSAMPIINWGQVFRNLVMFGGVTVILGSVVTAMSWLVNSENLGWIKEYGLQLMALVGVLTLASFLLSLIGSIFSPGAAGKGAVIMAEVAGALLLIGVALGAVAYGLKKLFESQGVDIMAELDDLIAIVYTIGALINALITGIALGALPNVGQSLSDFSSTIQPFVDAIGALPEDFGKKLKEFSEGFAEFTSAGFWYNFKDFWQKGDLFQNTIKIITNAAEPLGKMATTFAGITDLNKLAEQLTIIRDLGPAITSINDAKTNNLEKDVFPFLTSIATNVKDFGDSLSVIDDESINKIGWITRALDGIGKAAGGFYNEFGGLYQLGEIGDELDFLGAGVESFLTATFNISEDSITKSNLVRDMIMSLLEMNNSIGKNTGVAPWFQGWTDIGTFGTQLGTFVTEGLTKYCVALDTLTLEYLKSTAEKSPYIASSISSIASIGKVIDKNKGVWPTLSGKTDFSIFGEQLGYLADGIITYMSKMAITQTDVDNLVNNTNGIVGAINKVLAINTTEISRKFVDAMGELATAAINGFQSIFTSEETKENNYTSVVKMLGYIQSAARTISENEEYIKSLLKPIFDALSNATAEQFAKLGEDYETLADNIVSGYVTGLENSIPKIEKETAKINNAIDKANNVFWETQSPSKRTFRLGNYIGQGMANGLLASKDTVAGAYQDLNEELGSDTETTIVDAAKDVYGELASAVSNTVDDVSSSNEDLITNIKTFFYNLKNGVSDYTSEGLDWVKGKFDEFISQYAGEFNGTNWMNLVFGTGGNPMLGEGADSFYDQLQTEFEKWLSNNNYELPITPVFTDENGNEITDWQSMLDGSSGSFGRTVAGYTSEDIRNLTAEIYHLEDALFSLKEAMQDQKVTHSGEVTLRYANNDDLVQKVQTAIIGNIRREVRG